MSSEINDSDIQLLLILLNQDGWDWYLNVCTALVEERDALLKERDALLKERDEARREVCGFHNLTGFLAGDYAISRGWDCYKDHQRGWAFPKSVTDFKEFLDAHSEENLKSIERLQEENRQLRELKKKGVVSEPVKATPPHYDYLEDLG
jgi:hypothetical protein